ncbi:MAG: MCE family protein [Pseudonocardia sp.]|nr:MCE family protein [Pseudonocardia sp.]
MTRPSRGERVARTVERIRTEPGLARNTFITLTLIALALVVGGIILSQQRFIPPWADRFVIYATFPGSPGVSPGQGQEVRIAGVQVGQIVDADVDKAGHARLQLSLDSQFKGQIYDNATVLLRPKSPLNEMYIIMNPGGPPGKPLVRGDVLPVSNGKRPIEIDEVLGHLDDNARSMLTELLAESDVALVNAKQTLPPGLDAVRTVGNDLRPVAEELTKRRAKLRTLITALAEIGKAVGHDDARLRMFADSLNSTLGTLAANDKDLRSTISQLPDLLHQLRRATDSVQGLADELDPTLRDLDRASKDFPEALEDLEHTSDQLDDVVEAARPFLHAAWPVIDDLRPFTWEARRAVWALHESTRELDHITYELVPYLGDLGAFIVQTRSITSMTDANSGILRGTLPVGYHSLPPFNGPNNGFQPIPAPTVDKGTTELQKQVPTGPTGDPAPRQDGSRTPRGNTRYTPGEHKPDNFAPPSGAGLLPLPNPHR